MNKRLWCLILGDGKMTRMITDLSKRLLVIVGVAMLAVVAVCAPTPTPVISPANFVAKVDNPYFPLTPVKT